MTPFSRRNGRDNSAAVSLVSQETGACDEAVQLWSHAPLNESVGLTRCLVAIADALDTHFTFGGLAPLSLGAGATAEASISSAALVEGLKSFPELLDRASSLSVLDQAK